MRHLLYTMFITNITNNLTSFQLWLKERLVKYQKVSKYYDHGCSPEILLNVKLTNNHILVIVSWEKLAK